MSTAERTWSEAFIWHIRQAPFQLAHMRELAETTVSAQAAGAGKITGTKDRATLPYRVDPADDADHLYLRLVKFGRDVAHTIGGASPHPLRARMWRGGGGSPRPAILHPIRGIRARRRDRPLARIINHPDCAPPPPHHRRRRLRRAHHHH